MCCSLFISELLSQTLWVLHRDASALAILGGSEDFAQVATAGTGCSEAIDVKVYSVRVNSID